MIKLILAVLVLMLGAGLCLLPVRNAVRAAIGLVSQAIATVLTWWVVIPVLMGGPDVTGEMPWSFPIGTLHFRLDALGAFFLSWSLPMTLLGSIYAVGYMQKYFGTPRHLGVHFGLLNMISVSFLLVYTGEHAGTFSLIPTSPSTANFLSLVARKISTPPFFAVWGRRAKVQPHNRKGSQAMV